MVTNNAPMQQLLRTKAAEFYERDVACPLAYEPSGQDFLSPCLAEADFMRRVLAPEKFAAWLTAFLPSIPRDGSTQWLAPAEVTDRSDPKLAHLDGLNLSRAWMLEGIARGLPAVDERVRSLQATAARHREASLGAVSREHAEFMRRKGSIYLVDRSTNGTYVRPQVGKPRHLHREEFLLDGSGEFSHGRPDGPPVEYKIS